MTENVAVVTGGSTGIGAEICQQMLDAGILARLENRGPVEISFADFRHVLRAIELDEHVLEMDAMDPVLE